MYKLVCLSLCDTILQHAFILGLELFFVNINNIQFVHMSRLLDIIFIEQHV